MVFYLHKIFVMRKKDASACLYDFKIRTIFDFTQYIISARIFPGKGKSSSRKQ